MGSATFAALATLEGTCPPSIPEARDAIVSVDIGCIVVRGGSETRGGSEIGRAEDCPGLIGDLNGFVTAPLPVEPAVVEPAVVEPEFAEPELRSVVGLVVNGGNAGEGDWNPTALGDSFRCDDS